MKIRFLLDECESPRLKTALLRFNPAIDVLRVGDPGAPHLETLDPEILRYLEVAKTSGHIQPIQHACSLGRALGCRRTDLGAFVGARDAIRPASAGAFPRMGGKRSRGVAEQDGLDSVLAPRRPVGIALQL